MARCSCTKVAIFVFAVYLAFFAWSTSVIIYPQHCDVSKGLSKCLAPAHNLEGTYKLSVYASPRSTADQARVWSALDPILHEAVLDLSTGLQRTVNVTLPRSTRRNGTLYAVVRLVYQGRAGGGEVEVAQQVSLTRYLTPKPRAFNLMDHNVSQVPEDSRPRTHMQPTLSIQLVTELITFDRQDFPMDIYHLFQLTPDQKYKPLLYIDDFAILRKNMKLVEESQLESPLEVSVAPVSVGRVRIWTQFSQGAQKLRALGFSENDLEEVKGIFFGTHLYLLLLTFFISIFHLLFDFLAFKNDISFWSSRKSMVGLSPTMVLWRCFSQWIVFLYLCDEKTSLLILVPVGVGALIEVWKVWRICKFRIIWRGAVPTLVRDQRSKMELETSQHDTQAIKYLTVLLLPLVLAGAVYTLVYNTHKSWYSWAIHSLVNGVYAFGFLFMLPQLFLNYRLKTVAHLPWRAFMYKAFNTFIDDVFAFIITMPTSHRVAVFRDDIVFLIYLYQRWLYPVDKQRLNEFGEAFDSSSSPSTSSTSVDKQHKD